MEVLNQTLIFFGVILIGVIIGIAIYYGLENKKKKPKHSHKIIGGCKGTRWGCCPDGITPKFDGKGTNCIPRHHHKVGGCSGTRWGCCPDGRTIARGPHYKGC